MATRIRLKRCGAKKQPHYRVVVMEAGATRDGRALEEIGWYNPLTDPASVEIRVERALHWLLCGAQPTETVAALLKKAGVMERLQAARAAEQATSG